MAKAKRRAEDYLAVIYLLEEQYDQVIAARIADELDVTPATVSQTLARLLQEGLIERAGTGPVSLTPEGRQRAEALIRRHRLAERWMTDILGLPWWQAHSEALRLEQAISPSVEAALDESLGHPATCPHGHPIPGNGKVDMPVDGTLDVVDVDDSFVIDRVREPLVADDEYFASLAEMGLTPGREFRVVDKHPLALSLGAFSGDGSDSVLVPWALARRVSVRIKDRAAAAPAPATEPAGSTTGRASLARQAAG